MMESKKTVTLDKNEYDKMEFELSELRKLKGKKRLQLAVVENKRHYSYMGPGSSFYRAAPTYSMEVVSLKKIDSYAIEMNKQMQSEIKELSRKLESKDLQLRVKEREISNLKEGLRLLEGKDRLITELRGEIHKLKTRSFWSRIFNCK